MIDMHSHILPGIDDGALDMQEALELLRLAAADGVTTQVLTPHIQPSRYTNTLVSIRAAFERFAEAARAAGIALGLEFAAEVRIGPEIPQLVNTSEIPWLGALDGRKVLLLEFPHGAVPAGSINLIEWLLKRDIVPMLAHPERNRELQLSRRKLQPFLAAGCLVQITAGSVLGDFGRPAREFAEALLERGQVSLIATDCHNLAYRPPKLSAGVAAAARVVGEHAALAMVTTFPARLRQGLAT